MFAITSLDAIKYFENEDSFLSIFLTDRYETDVVRNLAESFEAYNQQLGHRWHLLLPSKADTYRLNEILSQRAVYPENFNGKLAKAIASTFGIGVRQFPCIVFLFGSEILAFKLPRGGEHLRLFFEEMSEQIDEFWFENNRSDDERKRYIRDVILKVRIGKAKIELINTLQKPKSYLKAISMLARLLKG